MLDTPELEDDFEQENLEPLQDSFAPQWSECVGVFNETDSLSRRQNEESHYRKHAVIGGEWNEPLTPVEYLQKATNHLNNLSADSLIELCQAEDFAVVKYDLETGELGIARRSDGTIKTFFRPNDISYILRKVNAGLWGEPDIVDGFELQAFSSDFADDAQKLYFYERLEALSFELPAQAHSAILAFAEGEPLSEDIFSLLARLGEYRFISFEFQRAILTEAQEKAVHNLRKKISVAIASFEALEYQCAQEFIQLIEKGLNEAVVREEELWQQALLFITNNEQLEISLIERQSLSYAILELKVLQIHQRLSKLSIEQYQQRLRKSDIYLRSVIHQLFDNFISKEAETIFSKIEFGVSGAFV